MEPTPLLLLLGLGWTCSGRLTVLPQEALVQIGGSIQLNCSLDCPDGTPQWKGLDTNLGNIISTPTYSLLLITNATVAMEGTKFCVGNCQGKSHQGSTNLQVYSLPDTLQLETQPKELVAGQPAHLHCSISKVYPPGSLTLSWYRGDQRLESPDAEEVADDEELFSYDSELEVPGEKVTEGMEFRCEVELLLPSDRSFHRATAVTVSTKAVAEQPTTESVTGQENPRTESPATTGNPPATDRSPTTGLGATTGNPPATDRSPTTGLGATTGNPTTELTSAESPTTEFIVTSHKPSAKATSVHWLVTTETLATESRAASQHPSADWSPSSASSSATENPTTGDVASTENPLTKKATGDRSRRTESVCNLQIRPVPPKGTTGEALKIICEAECGENVTIRWLKTPVVLSQYQEEASEGKSTLTVDRVGLDHQGIYECFMLSRRLQVARLHIAVSADIFSTDSAILVGTASSLLGLIVTAFASRRLWRRLHPPGVKSSKGNSV
ncbi:mucosal addressin cell adhesion molecule 1 isoform X2 [Malaclemys terrapin pileata]|uniref:mucosal addressin cell adhesion molecule 1 isoform X2 n=1 Tax=Malaclemys terrapin pileata TaxID=2991368 RepID=UPI0023A7AEFE|nr:mucosal addressin cell adhesion molecule 1 isoform X2 [Malaclemys terrapin pileata]